MYEKEILRFKSLNQLAQADGTVIFGSGEDAQIPLGELKQAFSLNDNIYNRSIAGLSVTDAAKIYDRSAAELSPDTVLLHMGEADPSVFDRDQRAFEESYRTLIGTVRANNKNVRIAVVSLRNSDGDPNVAKLNERLRIIASEENCEFEDISANRMQSTKETLGIMSFLSDIGFDQPLRIKRPLSALVNILFCYNA